MANFCLMIQYDGTRYNGWQRQGNTSNTIQEKLETILEQLLHHRLRIGKCYETIPEITRRYNVEFLPESS